MRSMGIQTFLKAYQYSLGKVSWVFLTSELVYNFALAQDMLHFLPNVPLYHLQFGFSKGHDVCWQINLDIDRTDIFPLF